MNTFKFFLTAIILMQSISVFSQIDSSSKIVNTQFPDSWDKNRDLRNKRGQILAWVHYKSNVYENKICIDFVTGKDSLGRIAYYISGMHSSKKPFNKWNFMYTRIENYFTYNCHYHELSNFL